MRINKYKKDIIQTLTEIVLMIISVSVVIFVSCFYDVDNTETTGKSSAQGIGTEHSGSSDKPVLNVWYNNADYEQYFKILAEEYKKESGIDVKVRYVSNIDYLEDINKANREDGSVEYEKPDVYLLNTEDLEAAYGYGLAKVNDDTILNEENFPRNSLAAVTYKGKYVAYPLAYDTAFMLYNRNYMSEAPESFEMLIRFLNAFDYTVNSGVKRVFYFNVSDTMHNYCFAGAYLNFGGIYGDDEDILDIENDGVKQALSCYGELAKAVGIDINDSELDKIPEKFAEEEIICTIVNMKEFNEIRMLSEGTELNYNACVIPGLNEELETKSLSVTQSLVINYMSDKEKMAEDFVRFAVLERSDLIYGNTGFMPARHTDYKNQFYAVIQNQYEDSANLPKLMISADYYVLLGEVLNQAWQGEQIEDLLHGIRENYRKRTD